MGVLVSNLQERISSAKSGYSLRLLERPQFSRIQNDLIVSCCVGNNVCPHNSNSYLFLEV